MPRLVRSQSRNRANCESDERMDPKCLDVNTLHFVVLSEAPSESIVPLAGSKPVRFWRGSGAGRSIDGRLT